MKSNITLAILAVLTALTLMGVSCVDENYNWNRNQTLTEEGTFHWAHEACWFVVRGHKSVGITFVPDKMCREVETGAVP